MILLQIVIISLNYFTVYVYFIALLKNIQVKIENLENNMSKLSKKRPS
jgi:hypothetical protein